MPLGPRLIDGFTALQWVRYHAARGASAERPAEHLRGAARQAARSLERLAPLPWAAEAVRLALDLGRRLEDRQPAAALGLYTELRGALDRAGASSWRARGLEALAAEARRLEDQRRARAGGGA